MSFVFVFRRSLLKTNIFALVIRPQNVLRRLDKDQYIHLGHTRSRRLQDVFRTFPRRLQDVFKMSSRCLAKTSSRHLQDVLKTFWISLKGVFKIFSRRLTKTSSRHLQDVLKTYHQVKLFLLTRLQDVLDVYSSCF